MGVVPYWAWAAAAETSAATKRNKTLGMVFITILLLGMAGGRGEHADKGARHLRSPTRLNPSAGGMTRCTILIFSRVAALRAEGPGMGVPSRRGLLRKGGSPRSPRSWDSLEPIFLSPARGFWQGDNCTALLSCLLLGYYTVFYVPPPKSATRGAPPFLLCCWRFRTRAILTAGDVGHTPPAVAPRDSMN